MSGIILTTSPTPQDVRFRLLQIASALAVAQPTILKKVVFDTQAQLTAAGSPSSGVLLSDCALTTSDLPALAGITIGEATRVQNSTGNRFITRDYEFLVLFFQLCDASMAEQEAALNVGWAKVDELPDYFASRSVGMLRFNDSGLRGVAPAGVGHMADSAINPREWLGKTYSATTYTIPITTLRG